MTRSVACSTATGILVPPGYCRGLAVPPFQATCNSQPCPALMWLPSTDWSACSAPCDSRGVGNTTDTTDPRVLGLTTASPPRCVRTDQGTGVATIVPYQQCVDGGLPPPATSAPCNRFPCPVDAVVWSVGEWGRCEPVANASAVLLCGFGVQARRVSCIVAGDGRVVDDTACVSAGVAAPVSRQECSAGACACTASVDCPGDNAVCDSDSGECGCEDGWGGADCSVLLLRSVDASCSAATAIVDVNGTCCEGTSAVDSVTGLCCGSGAMVDGDGRCCDAGVAVDACGVCGGDGVVLDVDGMCCSTALAPSGSCCDGTGTHDSCGVCGGTNDCGAVVVAALPQDADVSGMAAAIGVATAAIVNVTSSGSVGGKVSSELVRGERG